MDNTDVIEKVVTEEPELPVHVPYANYSSPGIASFNSTDFHVEQDGEVQLSKEIKAIREDAEEAAAEAASSAEEAGAQAELAETYMQSAQTAASDANNSALSASGSAVQSSAYAEQAKQSAQNAADSATEAEGYKDTATQQAQAAASSASAAAQSASNAVVSANTATDAKSAAQTAEQNAEQSATDAETFAGNAETSASQAADSALLAQQYRDQAKEYAQKEYQIYNSFDALPRPGDSAFIYLVPASESQTNDKYNEYLWIDNINDYEYLGAVNDIDLSNYAQQNGAYPNMTVGKATADANGNNIVNTYATKAENNAKYTKPSSGIPESDLAQAVKDKLNEDVGIQNYEVIVRQTLPAADANSPDFVQTADGKIYRKKVVEVADLSTLVGVWKWKEEPAIPDKTFYSLVHFRTLNSNWGGDRFDDKIWIRLDVRRNTGWPIPMTVYNTKDSASLGFAVLSYYENEVAWSSYRYQTISIDSVETDTNNQLLEYMKANATKEGVLTYSYEEIGDASSIAAKYTKPSTGIPESDLSAGVQTSLGKADTALQSVPLATSSAIGGVKPVAKTSTMTQSVGVDANGALFTAPSGGGGSIEYMTNEEVRALFATTIQFTIQGKSYTANKNSTWQEWLNGIGAGQTSAHGDAFYADSSAVRAGAYSVRYNGNEVSVNDTIIENAAYTLEVVSGGGSVIE